MIHRGHKPAYTKETKPVTVAVANYIPVDPNSDFFRVVPGTRLSFRIPAHFLVSKWNLMGGDQESIVMEANSKTLRPWQECLAGTLERPVPRCPGERPLLIRIWSDIRPAVPMTIRPDLKAFPAEDRTSFDGRQVRPVGESDGYQIVGYDDVWTRRPESRVSYFGKTNLYSSSLFLYPQNYQKEEVKFVDCVKIDTFCKAYLPFRGKWVEFQVYKDQMSEIREIASGIVQTLSKLLAR
ncbi:hypothetical protein GCM10022276_06270 [Sphingomonas limnosediminicola]|uniref:Uncharacterized protein n=1 Tax=Sphingomonas limnosediminicola TaxID=940133 RepID=A0ABP7L127_9SPHN